MERLKQWMAFDLAAPRARRALVAVAAIVLVFSALAVSKAFAADKGPLGKIAAPEVTLTSTAARWSGPWLAVTLGYALQTTDLSADDLTFATHDLTYGGAAGWDHQFAGTNLLIGIGCDLQWSRAESAIASWDRQWSCWGRGGVLIAPAALVYAGAGYTELSGAFEVPELGERRGLTVLGGIEVLFKDGWFVALEGRWVDLGGDGMGGIDADSHQYAALLRLGYKIGGKQ
jgi:opacity protein-like surface antigen